MKPLTTLGDALMAKGAPVDWRADLRANDIPRRPPPASETRSSRPDRGYVEQPEERVLHTEPRTIPRRREETPTLVAPVALIRFSRDESHPRRPYMDPNTGQMVDPNAEAKPPSQPEPPPPSEPAVASDAEESEVPKKARKQRIVTPLDEREQYAIRIIRGGKGEIVRVAKELNVSTTGVAKWPSQFKQAHPNWQKLVAQASPLAASEKTQLSRPTPSSHAGVSSAIASMVRPASTARTFETVSAELQEALNRVKELKRELRGLLGDD